MIKYQRIEISESIDSHKRFSQQTSSNWKLLHKKTAQITKETHSRKQIINSAINILDRSTREENEQKRIQKR